MADTTFITNQGTDTLKSHFKIFMKNTKSFSCLVGYFFARGFFRIYRERRDVDFLAFFLIGSPSQSNMFHLLSSPRP